eukprot:6119464-Heterocapsa_arctica.AAC.1
MCAGMGKLGKWRRKQLNSPTVRLLETEGIVIRVACPGKRQGEIWLSPPTLLSSALYLILDTDG